MDTPFFPREKVPQLHEKTFHYVLLSELLSPDLKEFFEEAGAKFFGSDEKDFKLITAREIIECIEDAMKGFDLEIQLADLESAVERLHYGVETLVNIEG